MTPNRTYLIIHGWQASGAEHWQTWLARRLADAGEHVLYPLLPNADFPVLEEWLDALHENLLQMRGEKIVLGHSLAAMLWFHYATKPNIIPVDRLLLVAPACPVEIARIADIKNFVPVPLDAEAVARSAKQIHMVCSTADEYCADCAANIYAKPLNITCDILPPETGHINVASGFGAWERVEQWCYDSKIKFV